MSYRPDRAYHTRITVVPHVREHAYIEPPTHRCPAAHGIGVKMRFDGYQGPLRHFRCDICGKRMTLSVD